MLYNCSCFKYVNKWKDTWSIGCCCCFFLSMLDFSEVLFSNTACCYSMGFSFLVCFAKNTTKTVVQLGTEGIISLYVCISPWKKSILFFSFACSTFLKVLKETKTEINIIITLNLGSTNYERLLHWGPGLRKKRLLVLDVCLLIPRVKLSERHSCIHPTEHQILYDWFIRKRLLMSAVKYRHQ